MMWGPCRAFSVGNICVTLCPMPPSSLHPGNWGQGHNAGPAHSVLLPLPLYLHCQYARCSSELVLTDSISLRLSPSIVWDLTAFCQLLLMDSPTESSFLSRRDSLLFSSCLLSPLVIKGEAWLQLQFVLIYGSKREERGKCSFTLLRPLPFLLLWDSLPLWVGFNKMMYLWAWKILTAR